jgi:UDP-glucose 4-epimerase
MTTSAHEQSRTLQDNTDENITDMNGTRVVVTGGAGLIGKPLCDYLLDHGCQVHVLDDFSNSDPDNVDKRCHVHIVNLIHNNETVEIINNVRPEVIFHLACHPYEGLSQFCPHDVSMTTYMATVNVVSGAVKCGTVKRFVNYSSMARYGSGHRKDNGEILPAPFLESYIPNPEDVYAVSKVAAEKIIEIMCDLHGIEWVNCIPHNVYGEANLKALGDPYRGVLLIWVNCLLRGKSFFIYGDGEQTRAPSYVGDCVPAMARLGFQKGDKIIRQSFNIGANREYTLNELAQITCSVFSEVTGREAPQPIHVESRPCEVKHAFCNNDKSMNILGYRDQVDIREGIRRLIMWARNVAPNGVEPRYRKAMEIEQKAPRVWIDKKI